MEGEEFLKMSVKTETVRKARKMKLVFSAIKVKQK